MNTTLIKPSMPRPLQLPISTRNDDLSQPAKTFRESLYSSHPEKEKDLEAIFASTFRFRNPTQFFTTPSLTNQS